MFEYDALIILYHQLLAGDSFPCQQREPRSSSRGSIADTDDTIFLSSILRLRLWKLLFRYWDWDLEIKIFDTDTETETWKSQFSILRLIPESLTILRLILRLLLHRTMKFQLRLILRLCNLKNRYWDWDWDLGMWKIDTDTETETQGCEKSISILRLRPASLTISRRYR